MKFIKIQLYVFNIKLANILILYKSKSFDNNKLSNAFVRQKILLP